jgi:hypothetical protein
VASNFEDLLLLFGPVAGLDWIRAGPSRTGSTIALANFLGLRTNLLRLGVLDGAAVTFHGNVKAITDRQNILILQA